MDEIEEIKCKTCGEALDIRTAKDGVIECKFCATVYTLPKEGTTPEVLSYLRMGEHNLDTCNWEGAIAAFKKACEKDSGEPEAFWGMALARYKVQYLKDFKNNRLQPICHEISSRKFSDSKYYQKALKFATPAQRAEYERKAAEIDYIKDEFYKLSQSGLDYDCFICVKVTDEKGEKTEDYKDAEYVYDLLKNKGYSPFFSERSIRNRTGADYEAMILYALYSSETMLVVCRNEDYLHTPWVKNEYTRFLRLVNDEEKESDSITFVYYEKPIDRLPGRAGKLQGIDFSSRDADGKIVGFVEKHTPQAKAKREEAKRRKEEEAQIQAQRFNDMQEQLEAQKKLIEIMQVERLESERQKAEEEARKKAEEEARRKAEEERREKQESKNGIKSAEQLSYANKESETVDKKVSQEESTTDDSLAISSSYDSTISNYKDSPDGVIVSLIVGGIILGLLLIGGIASAALLKSWIIGQWTIGLGGGVLILVGLIFLGVWIEDVIYFADVYAVIALCVTIVANVVLFVLFRSSYEIIFWCISGIQTLVGIGFGVFLLIFDEEDMYIVCGINLIVEGVCALAIVLCFEVFYVWISEQWIFGIGGGILLTTILFSIGFWLDDETVLDYYIFAVIASAIVLVANAVLSYFLGDWYTIIFWCISGIQTLAGIGLGIYTICEWDTGWGIGLITESVIAAGLMALSFFI